MKVQKEVLNRDWSDTPIYGSWRFTYFYRQEKAADLNSVLSNKELELCLGASHSEFIKTQAMKCGKYSPKTAKDVGEKIDEGSCQQHEASINELGRIQKIWKGLSKENKELLRAYLNHDHSSTIPDDEINLDDGKASKSPSSQTENSQNQVNLAKEVVRCSWKFKQYATSERPLYNLHLLKEQSNKPILIVEGEKAADAATKQFTDFVVISWSGGSGAVSKTDWRPLKGKDIVIWSYGQIMTKPGFNGANQISTELRKLGVQKLRLVEPETLTKAFPEKWGLADPLPTGKTQQNIKDMITSSKEVGINLKQVLLHLEGKTSHPATDRVFKNVLIKMPCCFI